MDYLPTIGLEVHAELKTKTKMFCNSKNDPDETRANINVCPVCLAHPGTLPVINAHAVHHVLRVGAALGGKLADYTEFDRKNYFYPDLPKGYQISQYEFPLVSGGELRGVPITRVHLEEDTASSIHTSTSLSAGDEAGATLIDFNRAGVPLMELVTEPAMHSAQEAGLFARELQLLLRTLDVSEANMEKGEMRVEANVSVSKTSEYGVRVEIKNLNSFRAMERAVAFEIERQKELLKRGESVAQETRGWDEAKQSTFSQRTKEGSADYRYFPDPDLPSLRLSEIEGCSVHAIKKELPMLPWEKRATYIQSGLKVEDAELLVREGILGRFFDSVVEDYGAGSDEFRLAANFVTNDIVKIIRDIEGRDSGYQSEISVSPEHFREIIVLFSKGVISSRSAKDMIAAYIKGERALPSEFARSAGYIRKESSEIDAAVASVLSEHPNVVANYRAGKSTAIQYLVGQAMKILHGAADPVALRKAIESKIAVNR